MKPETRRIVRRWLIGLAILVLFFVFGETAGIRVQQVGWHLFHRNQLRLARNAYNVPLRWFVSSAGASDASLVDLPLHPRQNTSVMISESGPKPRSIELLLELQQQTFAKMGHIERVRRQRSGSEEITCIEGSQEFLPGFFVVDCWGSSGMYSIFAGDRARVDAYYAILSSARPI